MGVLKGESYQQIVTGIKQVRSCVNFYYSFLHFQVYISNFIYTFFYLLNFGETQRV